MKRLLMISLIALFFMLKSNAQVSDLNEEADSFVFVVTYVEGNETNQNTTILDYVFSDSACNVIENYIPVGRNSWVPHDPTKERVYVRVENPVSFTSGLINYYAASAGLPVVNKKGQIKFHIQETRQTGLLQETHKYIGFKWAGSAKEALIKYYGAVAENWTIKVSKNEYYLTAEAEDNEGNTITYTLYADMEYFKEE